jgi:hypothetical protein
MLLSINESKNPSQPPFDKGRRTYYPPFLKGDKGGLKEEKGVRIWEA